MSRYLLIASEDPTGRGDADRVYELAAQLRRPGNAVTLFLVQNAVLPVRASCPGSPLPALIEAEVEVLADEFSLRERGIGATELLAGVRAVPLDVVIDRLASGSKTLWA